MNINLITYKATRSCSMKVLVILFVNMNFESYMPMFHTAVIDLCRILCDSCVGKGGDGKWNR